MSQNVFWEWFNDPAVSHTQHAVFWFQNLETASLVKNWKIHQQPDPFAKVVNFDFFYFKDNSEPLYYFTTVAILLYYSTNYQESVINKFIFSPTSVNSQPMVLNLLSVLFNSRVNDQTFFPSFLNKASRSKQL